MIYENPPIAYPEKKKFNQSLLVLLLHVDRCLKISMDILNYSCTLPQCSAMKDLYKHMSLCYFSQYCPRRYCFLSKKTIRHWRECKRNGAYCEVCTPLRLVEENSRFKQDEQCPFLLSPLQFLTCGVDESNNLEFLEVSETVTSKQTSGAA